MEIRSLRTDEIKADFDVYAYRDELNDERVRQYQQDIDDLPPVDVFSTEEGLILAGGYHRLEAHRQEGRETITATIHQGTVVEAKMFACKANAQHGLNMTRSERQRSRRDFIKFNLERDPLMSNYDIARSYGGCNASTIQRDRKALEADGVIEAATQQKGADGKTYDVNNIGGTASANALAETLTVETWDKLTEEQQNSHCANYPSSGRPFNTQNNDSIEWARWSWNPVTGCLHGCEYCYARDSANLHYHQIEKGKRFDPHFWPERLSRPANTKPKDLSKFEDPVDRLGWKNVFTGSMTDLFGKWVPEKWIQAVLQVMEDNPQWNFLLLTKFPIRMSEFEYPDNVWLGTSVDGQHMVARAEKAFQRLRDSGFSGITWLSCEPMLERLTFERLDLFDWLVVGGQSKATKVKAFHPKQEWIDHLSEQAEASDVPVYFKTNLGVDDRQRVRDYPPSAMALLLEPDTDAQVNQTKSLPASSTAEPELLPVDTSEPTSFGDLIELVVMVSNDNSSVATDPMRTQFYKDKQKQVEYIKITSWVNEFIDDLSTLNSKFDGLLRKYKPGGISEALEKQNVEHRLNDIATECYWILENVDRIGGIPDADTNTGNETVGVKRAKYLIWGMTPDERTKLLLWMQSELLGNNGIKPKQQAVLAEQISAPLPTDGPGQLTF
jgi:protein gp37